MVPHTFDHMIAAIVGALSNREWETMKPDDATFVGREAGGGADGVVVGKSHLREGGCPNRRVVG